MSGITNISSQPLNIPLNYDEPVSSTVESGGIFKLDPDQAAAAKKIIEEKIITEPDRGQNGTIKPYLAPPKLSQTDTGKSTSVKSYNELMAELVVLLGEKAMDELQLRMDMYTRFSKSMGNASKETLEQIDTESKKYDEAKKSYEQAQLNQAASQEKLNALEQQKANDEKTLAQLEKDHQQAIQNGSSQDDIAKLASSIQDVKQKINSLSGQISNEKTVLGNLNKDVSQAKTARDNAASAMKNALDYLDRLNKKSASAQDIITEGKKTTQTAALLMAQIIAIMGESSEESLRANIEFSRKVQQAQQEKLRSDAEEVEAQQRKAKEMQETMGCIGKILGAIITVVSVVAAVFTGGASLAIAAIGLALMVSDEIYQKVTGNESFMSAALKPVLEHVIMPVIQAMADVISKVLVKFGMDPDTAQIVSTVLAVAIFVVVMILGAVLLKKLPVDKLMSAAGKMLGQAFKGLTSAMKNAVTAVDDVITRMTQPLTRFLSQLMGNEVKVKQMANLMALSGDVLQGVNAGVNAGGSIGVGVFEKKASDVMAEITLLLSASKIMQRFDKQIVDVFSAVIEKTNQMLIASSDMANAELAAGRAVLARTRA